MGGANEHTIDQEPRASGGQPRRRSGSDDAGKVIQSGGPNRTSAPLHDATGAAVPDSSTPARTLLADFDAADLANLDARNGAPPGLAGQSVRVHENTGEGRYHFHADQDGLKAAVPTADMWSAWRRLQHLGKFVYLDTENHTLLTIVTLLDRDPSTGGDQVHAVINLAPCKPTYSGTFDALDDTLTRKKK